MYTQMYFILYKKFLLTTNILFSLIHVRGIVVLAPAILLQRS